MADRFKFAEVRQKVIDIMKMDLLGPRKCYRRTHDLSI